MLDSIKFYWMLYVMLMYSKYTEERIGNFNYIDRLKLDIKINDS